MFQSASFLFMCNNIFFSEGCSYILRGSFQGNYTDSPIILEHFLRKSYPTEPLMGIGLIVSILGVTASGGGVP